MDHLDQLDHGGRLTAFRTEAAAFEKAVRGAFDRGGEVPPVPSCPGWSVTDLVRHLGGVHRYLAHLLRERLTAPPDPAGLTLTEAPDDPDALADWFAQGALELAGLFAELGPDTTVWTWSVEQTSGFWLRMQLIELAVHRWDAESATGTPGTLAPDVAADAVTQTIQVMAPARRGWRQAPPGAGERYRFRGTDGPESWTVLFSGDQVLLVPGVPSPADVEAEGSACDLALFLWGRVPATRLRVTGDAALLPHWFTLVPPV
ncbi:maleylpyruvate isomerase family mycothiol-dependent enzyme [Streptomyces spororaveus]|uniref:maleylpyruvate isomerase family mycothiol-dependent enzyme n=1 Tax=Streptomyces spororaveus TaxID=284039 RepID=UPI0020797491|nr:maleylpyruvate isomerase family mycothiol-dependent enzyme [Streptomyces spororaveus]MCM9077720.1 maleylpyruvate isomerase family mycothiol-dependent enzyme [Streptomyces spororaveus]